MVRYITNSYSCKRLWYVPYSHTTNSIIVGRFAPLAIINHNRVLIKSNANLLCDVNNCLNNNIISTILLRFKNYSFSYPNCLRYFSSATVHVHGFTFFSVIASFYDIWHDPASHQPWVAIKSILWTSACLTTAQSSDVICVRSFRFHQHIADGVRGGGCCKQHSFLSCSFMGSFRIS